MEEIITKLKRIEKLLYEFHLTIKEIRETFEKEYKELKK